MMQILRLAALIAFILVPAMAWAEATGGYGYDALLYTALAIIAVVGALVIALVAWLLRWIKAKSGES